MTDDASTLTDPTARDRAHRHQAPETLALAVVWSADQPELLGELLMPTPTWSLFGRGAGVAFDPHPRLQLMRARPGLSEPGPPLSNPRLSRSQLRLRLLDGEGVAFERIGRAPLFHGARGEAVDRGHLRPGETLQIGNQLLLVAVRRRAWLPAPGDGAPVLDDFPFGAPDPLGLVGESPALWALRERILFAARRPEHVLITGASGTGKEMVAVALHRLGSRRPLVARNAATFPDALIDAELFGNARNYPNMGMPARPGLIGEADGSMLFLDELGELPAGLHAHLLRVLDAGEYQRLGESQVRHSHFRLVAATNRPPSVLKDDLRARLPLRIEVPGLGERREDIPLLARHLLDKLLASDEIPAPAALDSGRPRVSLALAAALVRHDYTTHLRELHALLLEALARRSGPDLEWAPAARPAGTPGTNVQSDNPVRVPAATNRLDIDPAKLQAALDEHKGSLERARRALGLSSRHALARLVTRHGLRAGNHWRPAPKS